MPNRIFSLPLLILISAAGCASGKSIVIQRESGRAEVVGTAKKESDALMSALNKAKDYCGDQKKRAVYPDEEDLLNTRSNDLPTAIRKIPGLETAFTQEDVRIALQFKCIS